MSGHSEEGTEASGANEGRGVVMGRLIEEGSGGSGAKGAGGTKRVKVELLVEGRSDDGPIRQSVAADQYVRGGIYYLRYAEPEAEFGRTLAIVKLERDRIALLRQGEMETDLRFVEGARLPGYYRTAQGRLELEVETLSLAVDWSDHGGTATWRYRLYAGAAGGSYLGHFELSLSANPLKPQGDTGGSM